MTQPDFVVVELCKSRINILSLDEETLLREAKNINLDKIRTAIRQVYYCYVFRTGVFQCGKLVIYVVCTAISFSALRKPSRFTVYWLQLWLPSKSQLVLFLKAFS